MTILDRVISCLKLTDLKTRFTRSSMALLGRVLLPTRSSKPLLDRAQGQKWLSFWEEFHCFRDYPLQLWKKSLKSLKSSIMMKESLLLVMEKAKEFILFWTGRLKFVDVQRKIFAQSTPASERLPDVIALTKMTCLMLPSEHYYLLQPKSIWNADETQQTCAPVESILHVDLIEANLFQATTLPYAPKFGNVFGGQLIGHTLAAASKTVDCSNVVHHLQAYFLHVGVYTIPFTYEVHRLSDGKSFASRRVDAIQKGNVVFTLLASFQKDEKGLEHQDAIMPLVPAPDALLSLEELREKRIIDPRIPRTYRNEVVMANHDPWPIDVRFCDPITTTNQTKSRARLRYWFKSKGKLSDDQALHRCVVAYASDFLFMEISLYPHRQRGVKFAGLTLNHTMWFHRPVKADDWLLFVIESPSSCGARALVSGHMFNKNGELVVSLGQEGLVRKARTPNTALKAKF